MSVNNSLCLQLKQKEKVKSELKLPVNAGDTRNILLVADSLRQQPVSDLPGEHGGVLLLVFTDGINYRRRGHLGFAAAYNSGFIVSGFIIPAVKKMLQITIPVAGCRVFRLLKDKKIKRKQKILD